MSVFSSRPATLALGFAMLVGLGGCARPAAAPAIFFDTAGEVTGTWTGTWAGTPLTLAITEHSESAPYSGLYFGPWLVSGQRYAGVAGIMTFTSGGSQKSVHFNGWISSALLLVAAGPPEGPLQLRLKGEGPGRLTGDGSSTVPWGPQGPVELTRR